MSISINRRLSFTLYLNYFLHGIGLIILAQNMAALGGVWGVPIVTVSMVMSGVGIGRLSAYLIVGALADRFGRKPFLYFGMLCYALFFSGMAFAKTVPLAYFFAILAGVSNSGLDTVTYPIFLEMGGSSKASNILIKAAMSLGEFVLPLYVAFNEAHHISYSVAFVIAAVIMVANMILLAPLKLPASKQVASTVATDTARPDLSRIRRAIATVAFSVYGYTSMAFMILFTQWISLYATQNLHYSSVMSHLLLSLYSIGSITGVLLNFFLLKRRVNDGKLLVALNAVALLAFIPIAYAHNLVLVSAACFIFGMTAAGGMMQVGVNIFLTLFPNIKSLITGLFMTFGSVASFTVPLITAQLAKSGIGTALRFDLVIGGVGLIAVVTAFVALLPQTARVTAPATR